MKRFLRPAGSLVSTALFTSVAIDGLSFVNQASANPNPAASRQTSESEKPDTLRFDPASNPPVESIAPPEATLTQQFTPVPAETAPPIATSEVGPATGATGQEQFNDATQTGQNKVAKLADLIAGAQRRITAEEAENLLGKASNPLANVANESPLPESTTAQNQMPPAASQSSLSGANPTVESEHPEAVSESRQTRLVRPLIPVLGQKQGAEKATPQPGLMTEALNLAESGQIDQARRIVQNARLLPVVQTTVLARLDELEAQQIESLQPAVAEESQAHSISDSASRQPSPAPSMAGAIVPGSVPLQRICSPLGLNPMSVGLSKPTAVNPLSTTEAAVQPAKSFKRLDSLGEDIKPDFSAALHQYYPFPPTHTAQINGVDNLDRHQQSLPEIGQRLHAGLTSSRLMRSHSVLTRFQITNLDKPTLKAEASQTKASLANPETSPLPVVETIAPLQSADCLSVDVSYRNALPASSQINLAFPLTIPAAITSMFGWRVHPISGVRRFHAGTDFGAPMGTPVLATLPGRVVAADYLGGYGNAIILEHPETAQRTLYGHLSTVLVQSGMWVEQGTVIGQVGSTGLSTGPHLHFEVRQLTDDGWSPIDPIHPAGATIAQTNH